MTGDWSPGAYRCLICDRVLEVFDGSKEIAYRNTVTPTKRRRKGVDKRFQAEPPAFMMALRGPSRSASPSLT
jgi:hypothetical protein